MLWTDMDGVGSTELFQAMRLSKGDGLALLETVGGDIAVGRAVMAMVDRLGKGRLGDVACLTEIAPELPKRAVLLLLDLLLRRIDRGVQDIYRCHFDRMPDAARLCHDERIASLEPLRPLVQDYIARFDWEFLYRWLGLERFGVVSRAMFGRLANLAFACNKVTLRFTYHCNIACRHCYNRSGPYAKSSTVPLAPLLDIVAQMPGAGLDHLALTGGEPMMYPDHVVALIAAARSAGVRHVSINTNGFWGGSEDQAIRLLDRMEQAGWQAKGTDRLKISAGVFHQEFLPLGLPLAAARCYFQKFGELAALDVETSPDSPNFIEVVEAELIQAGLTDKVRVAHRPVLPLGRGGDLSLPPTKTHRGPCRRIDQIVFDADGTVRPCCGLNAENRGVVIGRAWDKPLRQLVKVMQNDPVLQILSTEDMRQLIPLTGNPDDGWHGVSCELCQRVIGRLADKEDLQRRLFPRQNFYPFWL
ncbi:MAG TPA: radical SAM protein [Telmatospirillum sp.]|nr:radical SAM protein [Telmatospirillum sp.]